MNDLLGRKGRGQGLVEFAIILPILLLVLLVIIELARVMHAWLAVENGARFGVRYAVTGEYDPNICKAQTGSEDCGGDLDKQQEVRLQSIRLAARAGSTSILRGETADETAIGYFKVTVCAPSDPDKPPGTWSSHRCGASDVQSAGGPGERVTVVVDFNHPLLTPLVSSAWPELRLSSKRTATVEAFRIPKASGGGPSVLPPLPPTPRATPTLPPTPTRNATATSGPTPPECWNLNLWPDFGKRDEFRLTIHNYNTVPTYLSYTEFWFDHPDSPPMYLDWIAGGYPLDPYYNPGFAVYDHNTPVSDSTRVNWTYGDDWNWWVAHFDEEGDLSLGDYRVKLEFRFDGYSKVCTFEESYSPESFYTDTPAPTYTDGPSPTPWPTETPGGPTDIPWPTDTPGGPLPTVSD